MKSGTDRAGKLRSTTITLGTRMIAATGAMSRLNSKWSLS
jgi:hypothetical protein